VCMRCVSDGRGRTIVALLIAISDGHEFGHGLSPLRVGEMVPGCNLPREL
jgi:hypothetical protein